MFEVQDLEDMSTRDMDSTRAAHALGAKAQGALQTTASQAETVGTFCLRIHEKRRHWPSGVLRQVVSRGVVGRELSAAGGL